MLEIGSLVGGKYKVLNKIGEGGMSVVYLAMNEKANKQWAIKEVRKDGKLGYEAVSQRLSVEIELLKKLKHSSLPSIVDVIETDKEILIVMDYIEGNHLGTLLKEGVVAQEHVIKWAKQLCNVLEYMHTRKPPIIYRDMKPSNIMLKPDGNITLIDFGIAREFKEKKNGDTDCLGTPGFAAPEQSGDMGQTDERTDIYGLGITMYNLLTNKNLNEPPYKVIPIREFDSSLSEGLEKIILKCTQHNPEDRYQNCAELLYDLEHYDEIDTINKRKNIRKLACFAACVLLTIAGAVTSLWGYTSAENKKSEKYDEILRNAEVCDDYYEAVLTDPSRVEAYEQLNKYLTEDFILSREEGQKLIKLKGGLDSKNSAGFSEWVDVLSKLKADNLQGYKDVCYELGESFLFYYDVNSEYDRYSNAAIWFREAADKYEIAGIYCGISDCLELINQYNGAKIKQTEKMYEEYERLWGMLLELKLAADEFDGIDSRLQVWNEINNIVDLKAAQFLEVAPADDVEGLLNEIYENASGIDKSVIADDINELKEALLITLEKIKASKQSA